MKNYFGLIVILFLMLTSCDKTEDKECLNPQQPSDCSVPSNLSSTYDLDIKQLAVKRMYEIKSPDTALFNIPTHWQDTIAEGLAAIYNSNFPEKDTIFDILSIHLNSHYLVTGKILVMLDSSYAWTQEWINLNQITGNSDIDSFLSDYDLSVTDKFHFIYTVVLETESQWNIQALANHLEGFPGVNIAELNYNVYLVEYVVPDIIYEKIGDLRYFEFVYGVRRWRFAVDETCAVTYDKKCNIPF